MNKKEKIARIEKEIAEMKGSDWHEEQLEQEKQQKKQGEAWLKKIHEMIISDCDSFNFHVCSWLLESEEKGKRETELRYSPGSLGGVYGDLARFVLRKLEEKDAKSKLESEGYISARKWIESQTPIQLFYPKDFDSYYLRNIFHTFFHKYIDEIENQSAMLNYMVFCGVPVFTQENGNYNLLDENADLLGYMKVSGQYFSGFNSIKMPEWVDTIYIHEDHEKWHYKLDTDEGIGSLSKTEQDIVRETYRRIIGVPFKKGSNDKAYGTGSKLSQLVEDVVSRYYGINFDINEPDTWAKQKDIVEWLMKEHSLSKREAEAIDLVTRPDAARNK